MRDKDRWGSNALVSAEYAEKSVGGRASQEADAMMDGLAGEETHTVSICSVRGLSALCVSGD